MIKSTRHRSWVAAAAALVVLASSPPARPTEGGASHYLRGNYNDFSAGVFGPSGVYFRNEFVAEHGRISEAPIGGRLFRNADRRVWTNSLNLSLLTDARILGARYGAGISVPVVLYSWAEAFLQLHPGETRRQNDRSGTGDLHLVPLRLNWRSGSHHLMLTQGIFAPTGSYDRRRVMNLGRNHWGFNPSLTYTWLHEKRGHEVSLTGGFLVNTRNPDTRYRSGTEFHIDYFLAQHFSPHFAIGFPGYWYKQLGDDRSGVLRRFDLGGFRGEAAGIGLALLYRPTIRDREVSFGLRWVHDVYARRRFEGSQISLSAAFKF